MCLGALLTLISSVKLAKLYEIHNAEQARLSSAHSYRIHSVSAVRGAVRVILPVALPNTDPRLLEPVIFGQADESRLFQHNATFQIPFYIDGKGTCSVLLLCNKGLPVVPGQ